MQQKVTIVEEIHEFMPRLSSMVDRWKEAVFIIDIYLAIKEFCDEYDINDNFYGALAISPTLARTWESQTIVLTQSKTRPILKNYTNSLTTLAVSRLLAFLAVISWLRLIKVWMFNWID
jgi:hypothetical protein